MRNFRNHITLIFFLFGLIFSNSYCKYNKKEESWDVKNTEIVESYDEVNGLAIKMAKDSLFVFFYCFNTKNKNLEFYIKSKFQDNSWIENMWSIVNSISGDTIFATLEAV